MLYWKRRHNDTQGHSMQMKVETGSSPIHGTGVFATREIFRGAVVLPIDDSRVVDENHPVSEDLGENPDHCDWLPDGTVVLMQAPERFINHSCDPNAYVYSIGHIRFVLAIRDIGAGEEITYDYAVNAIDGDVWSCRCGAAGCRGRHKCAFFSLPEKRQLEYLPFLDPWFAGVHAERILRLIRGDMD